MIFSGEIKLTGDEYAGFYSCGLTMHDNSSMRRFKEVSVTDTERLLESEDGLSLKIIYEKSKLSDATMVKTMFSNNSKEPVTLELITSFLVPDIKADKIHRLLSFWSAEGRLKTDTLKSLNMEHAWNNMAFRVEKFGTIGSMPVRKYFPFLALEDSESGKFTAVQLYSPASWQIELICRHDDTVTISGGIADRDFGAFTKTIRPGESFYAPKAVIAEGNSLLDVCDKLVKAQNPNISPVDNSMGITFNEYCTTWGNPTIDNLKKIADKLEGKGIQFLVMDSGWYSKCGNWWEYRGDWSINKDRFPNGLKELTDYVKSKGMIPGLWYEFEVAGYKTELFNTSEHFVKKDGVPLTIGGAKFLDMEDPWVTDFLTKSVINNLKDNGFGYIKVDYNDTMGLGVDGPDGLGENLRRKVLCTQEFFRKMKREIPELVIENCSSGGHRLEPSMMELASQASFSDAHEIVSLPIIAANIHRVVKPSQSQIWSVLRKEDSDSRIYYSMSATFLGRMGLSGDIYDLSDHQWQLVDNAIAFYKETSSIIKDGKTTVLFADTESYNNPTGSQVVVRELDGRKLVVYHRFENSCDYETFVKAMGLGAPTGAPLKQYGIADKDFSAEVRLY